MAGRATEIPTGRRTVMTVTILRRTFNVRISVTIFGIEIEDGRTNPGHKAPGLFRAGSVRA